MATMTLMISVNVIASTIMRVVILEMLLIIPDIDIVIMAAAAITDVMATLTIMNTLL